VNIPIMKKEHRKSRFRAYHCQHRPKNKGKGEKGDSKLILREGAEKSLAAFISLIRAKGLAWYDKLYQAEGEMPRRKGKKDDQDSTLRTVLP